MNSSSLLPHCAPKTLLSGSMILVNEVAEGGPTFERTSWAPTSRDAATVRTKMAKMGFIYASPPLVESLVVCLSLHAPLLNDNGDRRGTGVARFIAACERHLMRAEWRASLDFQLECYVRVCCRDRIRRLWNDAHCWIRRSDRHIAGEACRAVYVYGYTSLCSCLRCDCWRIKPKRKDKR